MTPASCMWPAQYNILTGQISSPRYFLLQTQFYCFHLSANIDTCTWNYEERFASERAEVRGWVACWNWTIIFCVVVSGCETWSAAFREGGGVKKFENGEELQNEELLSMFQVLTAVMLKGRVFWEFKLRFLGISRRFGVFTVTFFSG